MGVTHIEIRGIQAFLFSTSRLLDTVGRSAQVERLTDPDAEPLRSLGRTHGVRLVDRRAGSFSIEGPPDAAFDEDAAARRAFVAGYSRWVAESHPSLRLVVAAPGDGEAPGTALKLARFCDPADAALVAPLGVVRCALTGNVATETLRHPGGTRLPVTSEVKAARDEGTRWHEAFAREAALPDGIALSRNVDAVVPDRFASSKVAVVLADLNGLGKMLEKWSPGDRPDAPDVPTLLRRGTRDLALHLARTVAGWTESDGGRRLVNGLPEDLRFSLGRDDEGADTLPFQPHIVGGDDLAFVCESRLAWSLADEIFRYLDHPPPNSGFDELSRVGEPFSDSDGRLTLTYGVGIAVVPLGYSLSRAQEAAHALARCAKDRRVGLGDPAPAVHALAWSLTAHRPSLTAADPASTVYLRRGAAARGDELTGLPEDCEPWDELLHLLDPAVPESLRCDTAPPDATSEGTTPWGLQRRRLKSTTRQRLLDLPASLRKREEEMRRILTDLAAWGPPLPPAAHRARMLSDAIALLDEHLTVPAGAAEPGHATRIPSSNGVTP